MLDGSACEKRRRGVLHCRFCMNDCLAIGKQCSVLQHSHLPVVSYDLMLYMCRQHSHGSCRADAHLLVSHAMQTCSCSTYLHHNTCATAWSADSSTRMIFRLKEGARGCSLNPSAFRACQSKRRASQRGAHTPWSSRWLDRSTLLGRSCMECSVMAQTIVGTSSLYFSSSFYF